MTFNFVNEEAVALSGERIDFSFGANWRRYLRKLTPLRVENARRSLQDAFQLRSFAGKRFLDLGCGSGLFSLCAAQLGAAQVFSIDVDPNSLVCAKALKRSFRKPVTWTIGQGSALDPALPATLGQFDLVYCWGVVHHTGAMWQAVENVLRFVAPGGRCCLGIYSRPPNPARQLAVKRAYNHLPKPARRPAAIAFGLRMLLLMYLHDRINPLRFVREYENKGRGMDFWRDIEDWLGGLPYEFADPEQVRDFAREHGFRIDREVTGSPGRVYEYLLMRLQ